MQHDVVAGADYYTLLGVAVDHSPEELKKAYKRMSKARSRRVLARLRRAAVSAWAYKRMSKARSGVSCRLLDSVRVSGCVGK